SGFRAALGRVAPAIGLFFLAPLVAEFLLGNIAIDALAGLIVLAPFYGGAAVLIREAVRRAGRGWPSILLLGLAFGIFEEGIATQSLFNPGYVGAALLRVTYVPALGIGVWWTLFVLTLHTVWSISVPIALVEALVPRRRTTPWLGPAGQIVTAILFVFGALATGFGTYQQSRFIAPAPQLVAAVVITVALIAVAFILPRRQPAPIAGVAPDPWLVGAASLVAASVFLGATMTIGRGWLLVVVYLALYAVVIGVVANWSRRAGWGPRQILGLAGGALLAYAWHAFPQTPVAGSVGTVDLIGNAMFAIGAIILLAAAIAVQPGSGGGRGRAPRDSAPAG
ncbi:MAG TPA: hypothetical protein VFI22_17155, partial [Thermomicrobiales bacterium]|nr:hypothetical protein [Thermomicrobiales bacterium]